jgi:hypothetical protein
VIEAEEDHMGIREDSKPRACFKCGEEGKWLKIALNLALKEEEDITTEMEETDHTVIEEVMIVIINVIIATVQRERTAAVAEALKELEVQAVDVPFSIRSKNIFEYLARIFN